MYRLISRWEGEPSQILQKFAKKKEKKILENENFAKDGEATNEDQGPKVAECGDLVADILLPAARLAAYPLPFKLWLGWCPPCADFCALARLLCPSLC